MILFNRFRMLSSLIIIISLFDIDPFIWKSYNSKQNRAFSSNSPWQISVNPPSNSSPSIRPSWLLSNTSNKISTSAGLYLASKLNIVANCASTKA